MSLFEVCAGGGRWKPERKGEGRGRLSPGKKAAPLGPCWPDCQLHRGRWQAQKAVARPGCQLSSWLPWHPQRLSFRVTCVTQ